MSKKHDLSGRIFGFWSVKNESKTNKHRRKLWLCECRCGLIKFVCSGDLLSGRSKSCGKCGLTKGKEKSYNWSGYKKMPGRYWRTVIGSAGSRKIDLKITKEEAYEILVRQNFKCAITKQPLCFNSKFNKLDGSASLDRIDSSKPYSLDNIQWVHKIINRMKWNLTDT